MVFRPGEFDIIEGRGSGRRNSRLLSFLERREGSDTWFYTETRLGAVRARAEIIKSKGDGFLYVKSSYTPSRLFVIFIIKGLEYRRRIPFKVRWIPEVME